MKYYYFYQRGLSTPQISLFLVDKVLFPFTAATKQYRITNLFLKESLICKIIILKSTSNSTFIT